MEHFKAANAAAFAVEFTNTELFSHPIPLDTANAILLQQGMKKPQIFASSVRIPDDGFRAIYQQATIEH